MLSIVMQWPVVQSLSTAQRNPSAFVPHVNSLLQKPETQSAATLHGSPSSVG
jgi:hypothetical protein